MGTARIHAHELKVLTALVATDPHAATAYVWRSFMHRWASRIKSQPIGIISRPAALIDESLALFFSCQTDFNRSKHPDGLHMSKIQKLLLRVPTDGHRMTRPGVSYAGCGLRTQAMLSRHRASTLNSGVHVPFPWQVGRHARRRHVCCDRLVSAGKVHIDEFSTRTRVEHHRCSLATAVSACVTCHTLLHIERQLPYTLARQRCQLSRL